MAKETLIESLRKNDDEAIARTISDHKFTLLEVEPHPDSDVPDDADDDSPMPLVAEIDDMPVVVAFTSQKLAETFATTVPDLAPGNDSIPGFIMVGSDMFEQLPDDFGFLINPESKKCFVLDPEQVSRIKALMK